MILINNYINGEFSDGHYPERLAVIDPATATQFATISQANEADVAAAVAAAQQAFESWGESTAEYRCQLLLKIADLIEEQLDLFAAAESLDNGKPIWLAKTVDIPRAISNFRFFATAALHFASESHAMPGVAVNYTLRKPIGVVGCISPWNLPLYLFTWKIAPALAAGNCVIAKPSEVTPYTAFLLAKVCAAAGLPPGVLNILHGTGQAVGNAIVAHPAVKAISFTGGTATGKHIASIAAPMFKKLSLELGGKNPTLIFADCDWENMLQTVVSSAFSNQGQICLCGSRIFIEKSIYTKFKNAFVEKVKMLKVGDPNETDTRIGAVVSAAHFEKILSYITLAKSEGGKLLCGGEAVPVKGRCENGYFIAPAVIEGLTFDCRTNQEEIFGPVVTITPFETEAEVLAMANSVQYGLASSVWTKDIDRATRIAEKIEAGIVWINCWMVRDLRTPFGGTKASGVGREGGWEAMRFFTEPKNVCIKYHSY